MNVERILFGDFTQNREAEIKTYIDKIINVHSEGKLNEKEKIRMLNLKKNNQSRLKH